ncbi:hypothetical protein ACS0TY_034085 [Phlomoides rotata]
MRLSINTFYGISLGTLPNNNILFDPPIAQATQLESWLKTNKDYVQAVVAQKLYEKKNQSKDLPPDSQIQKINQISNLAVNHARSFWIKGHLSITKPDQRYYLLTCPSCTKPSGAIYKNDFTCLYCNNNFPSPKAQLRFEVELFDRTGSLNAFIEEKEAETILGISTEEVIDADMENQPQHHKPHNKKALPQTLNKPRKQMSQCLNQTKPHRKYKKPHLQQPLLPTIQNQPAKEA